MKYYEIVLWRLIVFPILLILTPFILFVLFLLRIDKDIYDTKESLFYLLDVAWNGIYK